MTYYSKKPLNNQISAVHTQEKFIVTNYKECKPHSRCHNYKKCKHCADVKRKREFAKAFNHITEKHLKNYKYKNFLTFVSLNKSNDFELKNACIDNFIKELIRSKRYKSSILHNSQYFVSKHISKKDDLINPHLHMIFLSHKSFKHSKQIKRLLNKYNLRVNNKVMYKENNNYKDSFKRLLNYCLKVNSNRLQIERDYNLTKGKRDIYKSTLFSKRKLLKKDKRLYRDIALAKALYKQKRVEAIRVFKRYNKTKISTYTRMLKSLQKKLKKIEKGKNYTIKRILRSNSTQ